MKQRLEKQQRHQQRHREETGPEAALLSATWRVRMTSV